MLTLSKWENDGQAFLKAYPIGSVVTVDKLLGWAAKHGNGLANDLLAEGAGKQFNAVRRHLNDGCASSNLIEASRFFLDIEDAKRKTVKVRALHEHVLDQADQAFNKSARSAISPLNRSRKALADIKTEELDPDEKNEIEQQLKEIEEAKTPLQHVLVELVVGHWVNRLQLLHGISAEEARRHIQIAAGAGRLQRILKALS